MNIFTIFIIMRRIFIMSWKYQLYLGLILHDLFWIINDIQKVQNLKAIINSQVYITTYGFLLKPAAWSIIDFSHNKNHVVIVRLQIRFFFFQRLATEGQSNVVLRLEHTLYIAPLWGMFQYYKRKLIKIFFLGQSDGALSVYSNFSEIVLKDFNNVWRISGWFLINCGGSEWTMVRAN